MTKQKLPLLKLQLDQSFLDSTFQGVNSRLDKHEEMILELQNRIKNIPTNEDLKKFKNSLLKDIDDKNKKLSDKIDEIEERFNNQIQELEDSFSQRLLENSNMLNLTLRRQFDQIRQKLPGSDDKNAEIEKKIRNLERYLLKVDKNSQTTHECLQQVASAINLLDNTKIPIEDFKNDTGIINDNDQDANNAVNPNVNEDNNTNNDSNTEKTNNNDNNENSKNDSGSKSQSNAQNNNNINSNVNNNNNNSNSNSNNNNSNSNTNNNNSSNNNSSSNSNNSNDKTSDNVIPNNNKSIKLDENIYYILKEPISTVNDNFHSLSKQIKLLKEKIEAQQALIEKRPKEMIQITPKSQEPATHGLDITSIHPYPAVVAHWRDPPELPAIHPFLNIGEVVDYIYRIVPRIQAHMTAMQGKIVENASEISNKAERILVEKMFEKIQSVISGLSKRVSELKEGYDQTPSRDEINSIVTSMVKMISQQSQTSIGRLKCIACGREIPQVTGAMSTDEALNALGPVSNSTVFHVNTPSNVDVRYGDTDHFDSEIIEAPLSIRPNKISAQVILPLNQNSKKPK